MKLPLKYACFLFLTLLSATSAVSQTATACRLLGTDTVTAGSSASFTLSACTAANWSVSCGAVVAQSPSSVTVNFNSSSCGTAVISSTGGSAVGASKTVTVLPAPVFSPGTAAATAQAIAYNKAPAPLLAGGATGGLCAGAYSYQWFSSTDNINFSPIAGATGQNYQPGPLTTTTYFKRQANCAASGAVTSGTMTVTVSPSLSGAILTPPVQTVNYDSVPGALSVVLPASIAGMSYQWQRASNASFSGAVNIAGGNNNTFAPGNLTSTTYYRAIMVLQGDSSYSSPAVVSVLPPFQPGGISPATQVVAYDSVPSLLSAAGVSGGNGTYAYQWYSSTDNINWTVIAGATNSGYIPAGITTTTYYRAAVTCNGVTFTGNAGVVNLGQP